MKIIRIIFVFFALAGLAACSMGTRQKNFQLTVEDFTQKLRHNNRVALASFANPKFQDEFRKNVLILDGLHISNAKIQQVFPDKEYKSVLVSMAIEYFPKDSYEVINSSRIYQWKYSENLQAWLLHESSPLGSR